MSVVSMKHAKTQAAIDAFYRSRGPCCAGCDNWRWMNSVVGDCIKSAPVSGKERFDMIGVSYASVAPTAGHVVTWRHHLCGEFIDSGGA